MAKVLAVVLTYHPTIEIFENIPALQSQVDHIIIVDNESTIESQEKFQRIKTAQIDYLINDKNLGVATGYNQGLQWGMQKDFDRFLLMDQDSFPEPNMVNSLSEAYEQLTRQRALVLIGPFHEDHSVETGKITQRDPEPNPLVITSGSFFSRTVIDKIGYYDDRLFIDHVDHDYCLRLAKAGGACYTVSKAMLKHRFGKGQVRYFLGKKLLITNYSPFRRFFMMRNRMVLYRRFGGLFQKWFWIELRFAFKDLLKVLLFEDHRWMKFKSALKGLGAGLFWVESKVESNKDQKQRSEDQK